MADHDLWEQALAIENRYGDRGPDVLKQKILELRKAEESAEAAFWSKVARCLYDLHAIRFDAPAIGRGAARVSRDANRLPHLARMQPRRVSESGQGRSD